MVEDQVINNASKSIQEYHQANMSPITEPHHNNHANTTNPRIRQSSTTINHWKKPTKGTIKVNSDANLMSEGRWGLGAVCRDSSGEVLAAATWEIPGADDPQLAEACALYEAVRFARDCCFRDVIFECDNSQVVHLLNSNRNPKSYVGNFIRGINCNRGYFRNCSFRHIGRRANEAAHCLALLAHDEPNRVWIEEIPNQLAPVCTKDLLH
jgi:ribonuclease HI